MRWLVFRMQILGNALTRVEDAGIVNDSSFASLACSGLREFPRLLSLNFKNQKADCQNEQFVSREILLILLMFINFGRFDKMRYVTNWYFI